MSLENKRVVLFVDQQYQEMEVWYPLYRFREAGVKVVTVGSEAGRIYPSKLGYPCQADKSYEQVEVKNFEGVVIPGGFAPDYIRRNPSAGALVKQFDDEGKLVAAICHGPWVLCSSHGLLKGRKATSFFAIRDDVVNAGAAWTDEEVVVDRNLVTSRKPDDLPAFCRACLKVLGS